MLHLITYTGDVKPANLGDVMQTVALSRLLGPSIGMRRDHEDPPPNDGDLVVVNGFWYKPKRYETWPASVRTLFAGIHIDSAEPVEPFIPWFASSPWPIGARDPATADRLVKHFPASKVVVCGCSTITLPRWYGNRRGFMLNVDCEGAPGERHTQMVGLGEWNALWAATLDRLELLSDALFVYTSKMHTTLPCVALGTPVQFSRRAPYDPSRLTLLSWLGVREDAPVVGLDTQGAQHIFTSFLQDTIGERAVYPLSHPVRPRLFYE
jgi:hypothetical protein